jgi:hypothetical protein
MSQEPLNMPECSDYYYNSWKNCMEGTNEKKDPENNDLSEKQLNNANLEYCCKSQMVCKDPNKFFKEKGLDYTCPVPKVLVSPHFGNVRMSSSRSHFHKVKETLSFGVF